MSNTKQTAVDWLISQFDQEKTEQEWEKVYEKAKAMEKEQKEHTWNNAVNAVEKDKWESFEQYYEETYGE